MDAILLGEVLEVSDESGGRLRESLRVAGVSVVPSRLAGKIQIGSSGIEMQLHIEVSMEVMITGSRAGLGRTECRCTSLDVDLQGRINEMLIEGKSLTNFDAQEIGCLEEVEEDRGRLGLFYGGTMVVNSKNCDSVSYRK